MEYDKTGKIIQELRKEKGMTQLALADKLGVTDRAVSKWERGKSFPDVSMLKPLSEALGISVSELLDGERRVSDEAELLHGGAATLTVEEADQTAMHGIQTYIHETQRKERIWMGIFLIVLVLLGFTAGRVNHLRHLPVDFQNSSLEFNSIRVVMEDGSAQMIYLDDPEGEELKRRIQHVLRKEMPETVTMGKLDGLPTESRKGTSVELVRLVTLYTGVYYDQKSWEYYTFPDINRIYQRIYSMCIDWLEDTAD